MQDHKNVIRGLFYCGWATAVFSFSLDQAGSNVKVRKAALAAFVADRAIGTLRITWSDPYWPEEPGRAGYVHALAANFYTPIYQTLICLNDSA